MTRKYLAIYKGDVVGKRSTRSRTYTHAIIARPSFDHAIARSKATWKFDAQDYAFHCSEANPETRKYSHTVEGIAEHERVAAMTLDEHLVDLVKSRVAAVEANKEHGKYDLIAVT